MIVILDNGHGQETAGKRSPLWNDGKQLFEYEFNRDVVKRITLQLHSQQIPYRVLVPELSDIGLTERVRRANEIYAQDKDAFLVSIHANAGGGTGWEAHTSPGTTKSDEYSAIFYREAHIAFSPTWKIRKGSNNLDDPDWDSAFAILTKTKGPAILTENFFMDTEVDCRYIMGEEGRQHIANMHVDAIKKIYQK